MIQSGSRASPVVLSVRFASSVPMRPMLAKTGLPLRVPRKKRVLTVLAKGKGGGRRANKSSRPGGQSSM